MTGAYTPYRLKGGRVVNIPNSEIAKLMPLCGSRQEAVDLWLCDNGYATNDEQTALERKATSKENKVKAKADYKPKTQKERVAKEQPIKEEIISTLAKSLESIGATQIEITNKAKTINFIGKDGEPYAIDVKWERNKSKALKEGKG